MYRFCVVLAALAALVAAGSASAGVIKGQYVVVLKGGVAPGSVAREHARSAGADVSHVYERALNGYAARLSGQGLARVRADSRVLFVSADREVHAVAQTLPTGIDRIDGEQSSAQSGNGSGSVNIGVAVIDTGIDVDHPDLRVVGGRNCSTGRSFDDGNGHGTHVAGTIAAKDDTAGVVGVVPGASLWAVRVLNNAGSGSWSSVVCGIDWVTANASSNGIEVANMSLGGSGSDDGNCGKSNNDALHQAICNSVAAGVTYVVAAGNDAADLKGFVPAAYDEVLTTTATADFDGKPGGLGSPTCRSDVDETYADFSNFATLASDQAHTIAAPGVCILSTWKGGGYKTISGTSMASPHMAGTAALCIAVGECTGSPGTIVQKLRSDAATYNTGNTGYGFQGDPIRPVSGKYFGYLTRAAEY
jgi:subtilisin